MKIKFKAFGGLLIVPLLTLAPRTISAATVYSNTNNFTAAFDTGGLEVGDEITLGGTERKVTSFTFEYFGNNFTGGETAEVRFYKNDGPLSSSGYATPSTLLFDSGAFAVTSTTGATLNFSQADLNGGVLVPNNFTWSVTFSGLHGAATAGVDLYNPPTVGSSFADYWENNGGSWNLKTNANFDINFGSQFKAEAVPEPSTLALLGLSGVIGLALTRRTMARR